MNRLRKFIGLTPAARAVVLRSALMLPAVSVALRLRGMARTAAWLDRRKRGRAMPQPKLAPRELARLVDAAAAVVGASCLPRSLVLRHLLRERGIPGEIRFGVNGVIDGRLSAHAWVELEGVALNDRAPALEHVTHERNRRHA